ncbi:hypothetical protein HZA96_01675 [Candidatus Woesearchaeota archaeon]|nr:hypothetical protein [Candidatus Woesearchaeota archaeon]
MQCRRSSWIKQILAFECCSDAQIALQHTKEFSNAFKTENDYDNARKYFIGGYHADGTINANLMQPLKYIFALESQLQYTRLKEKFKH